MPTFIMLERQRERTRGRSIPNAKGNMITKINEATVYYLIGPEAPASQYIVSKLYPKVDAHAIGTFDNPPPNPPWKLLGPAATPQRTDYPAPVQTPPRLPPENVPSGVNPVLPVGHKAGMCGTIAVGTTPAQINPTALRIAAVTIKAAETNAGLLWFNFTNSVAEGQGVRIPAGGSFTFDIDDLSSIWYLGDTAGDEFDFEYEV